MTTVSVKCLECDTPTKNGRVYPRAELEQAIRDLEGRELLVTLGYSGEAADLSTAVGVAKGVSIRENYLTADIKFLDTKMAQTAMKLLEDDTHFGVRPATIASPSSDDTMRGIEFLYFAIVQNPA